MGIFSIFRPRRSIHRGSSGGAANGPASSTGAERRRRQSTFDPDDKWSNLYREREKNNLYKWVGVRSGGELITVYEKEGEDGVLTFAQEKLEPMMYNGGKFTQLIKYADYVRWKKTVNTVFGIVEEEIFNEADSKFREHEAQWRLNKRGVEGETIVHLLLNREEPLCSEIAKILINRYPGLAKDIYLGDDMFGQSALHLAIVHDDYDTVQLLLEKGAVVSARASGDFFLPEEHDNDHKAMDYQGYAYYGEYPLAFAACFENKDIYDLLIQYGANPDLQDVFGNTCLHMCVINYSNSMYSYAVRHWHKPAHSNIVNHAGYTPLTLATKLGRKQIFEEMLELMKVEFWRFSDMTCSAYPLDTLDTIRPDGSTNYDSALMTVINGRTPEHLEMIGSEVIQRLLADKWKAFASRKLFERLALLIFHLVCLSFVVYLRPTELERLYMQHPQWDDYMIYSMIAGDMVRFAIISAIFLVSFSQVFYFVGKDMSKKQSLSKDHPDYCPVDGYQIKTYSSYLETFVTLFRASMGGYDYEEFRCTNYEPLTKTLFVFYMFIMPIMMINILIAMMGNTYTTVITQAEKAWRQQYAQIVMVLERSMNRQRLVTCQLEYSIRLNDPGRETRGLMVIKQTKKTKARQRKQAINNWKRIGRKVIVMVKELGSEHTKFLLHSHDRIIDESTAAGVVGGGGGASGAAGGSDAPPISRTNRSYSNIASAHPSDDGGGGGGRNSEKQMDYDYRHRTGSGNALGVDTSAYGTLNAVVVAARYTDRRPSAAQANGGFPRRAVSGDAADAPPRQINGDILVGRHLASSQGGYAPHHHHQQQQQQQLLLQQQQQQQQNHYVHVTQRALPAAAGSRVRGVEMLPSVDVPNIPSNAPAAALPPPLPFAAGGGAQQRGHRPPTRPPRITTPLTTPSEVASSSGALLPSSPRRRAVATDAALRQRYGSNETLLAPSALNALPGGDAPGDARRRMIERRKTINTDIHLATIVSRGSDNDGGAGGATASQRVTPRGAAAAAPPAAPPDTLSYSPPQKRIPGVRADTFHKKDSSAPSSSSTSSKSQPGAASAEKPAAAAADRAAQPKGSGGKKS